MTTITTRSGKGSPLTNDEVDANFTGLNTDKVETSGDSMTGDLSFGDNNKVILGSGNDLKLYHDGSDSYVDDTGTGRLRLRGAADIILAHPTNGETYATFSANGANTFYYDNTARLATSSTGIDVTGVITTDGATIDGAVDINSSVDISGNVNMSGSGLIRTNDGTEALPGIRIGTDNDNGLYRPASNQIGFSTAGTQRMLVSSTGIDVTGSVTADGIT